MIGRRCRLFGGVALPALASGFMLVNLTAVAPVHAAACTAGAVIDAANGTTCASGSTDGNLTYPDSNGNYQDGDFTLTLDNHDVTGAIEFDETDDGGDGFIILENGSDVTNTDAGNVSGRGISAIARDAGEDLTIEVRGISSVTGASAGIHATSSEGSVTVKTAVGSNVTGTATDGIAIIAAGGGTVTADGNVTGGEVGINVDAQGILQITTGAGTDVIGGVTGIRALGKGNAVIVTTGTNSEVRGANDNGIEARGIFDGSVAVTVGEGATVATQNGENGIVASTDGGAIAIGTGANSIVSGGISGINANSVAGVVAITTGANSFVGGVNGIVASAANAVEITVGDDSETIARSGDGGGIVANSTNGPVTITTGARSGVGGNTTNGILAAAAGAVTITVGDNAGVSSNRGDGIDASSTSGGTVTISTGVASQAFGSAGDGILARSTGGAISITTGANSLANGSGGGGIEATTAGAGIVTITNNGRAVGSIAGIEAVSETGAIQITNNSGGLIDNRSLNDADLAIRTTGGAAIIDNNDGGLIRGRIETGIGNDALNNDGRWQTRSFSVFGDGIDTVTNNGLILAAGGAGSGGFTNFTGLETFNNSGSIILADQAARDGSNFSDRLVTDGDYAGNGGALLAIDASLGGGDSNADSLVVGGNTSGVTRIVVNNTSLGAGALNTEGILVVNVVGTAQAGNFVLANGPIDAGFFVYDLIFNNTDQANDQFLLVSEADGELFEPLAAVAASQEIWRETADAWAARQQAVRDRLSFGPIVTAVADPPLPGNIAPENGLWFSGLGSWTARNSEISGFDLSYDQSIYGFVAGADFGVDLGSDGTVMFGVLAGYVDSSLSFDASPTSIKTDGATLGIYASLLQDGFFANVLIRADLLNQTFSAPSLGADSSDDADVVSIGARADIGYRFDDGGLFIEPMLSLDAVSTSIDEFSVSGADIDAGSNDSFRGGAGLRAGLVGERATASLTGRIWNVFATDNEVVFTTEDTVLDLADDGLEGLYGEISGQVDIDLSETTVLFAKGGVLFSDDITKPSVSGGFNFTW